jgi:hypothetical protein
MKAILQLVPALALGVMAPAWGQQGAILLTPAPASGAASASPSAAAPSTRPADTEYLRTTTESLEYCKQLYGQVDDLMRSNAKSSSADQARNLSQEGERLCQHGQTRSGILHLRRAYVLLHTKAEASR